MFKRSRISALVALASGAAAGPAAADGMTAAVDTGLAGMIPSELSVLAWAPVVLLILCCSVGLLWLIAADQRKIGRRSERPATGLRLHKTVRPAG